VSAKVRIVIAAVLAVVLAAPVATAEGKRSATAKISLGKGKHARATQECANADTEPNGDNLREIRDAIVCLHNKVRAQHDLPPLRENRRLRRAALEHSRSMVAGGFFEHTSPGGATMVDRILGARYARRNQGWALGENLAWGTGSLSTPRGAVQAWMDSRGHRANILKRAYRELGIGVVLGVPVSDAAGATYTVDFGVRRR
jgi:uncharacterized protein YkwD